MSDYGSIEIEVKNGPLGIEQEIIRWNGGPEMVYSKILLNYLPGFNPRRDRDIMPGDVIFIGPYRVRVIKEVNGGWESSATWASDVLLRRDDGLAVLKVWTYRFTRFADRIYRRLLITAAVWGLAYYEERQVPTWRNLKIARRFSRE